MSGLPDEVLTAHCGLERWRAVTALTAHGGFGATAVQTVLSSQRLKIEEPVCR
jgi:hypothetical protein